jgi:hypothetical protein
MMRNTVRLSVSLVLLALALAACGERQETESAVATPTLTFSKDRVPIGSAVTLTYKFVVAPNASFDKDYWVFVHVLDPDGEQMWTDDHQPPKPTTQWKAGETVEYKRTIFVPNYPYIGEAIVRLGLYDLTSGKRLALNATEASRREYVVAKVEIQASALNIYVIYGADLHQGESDLKNAQSEWNWTKKTGSFSFKNPKKDVTLYLQYDARPDLFTPPQEATIKVGDQEVGRFTADSKLPKLVTVPVTAAQLGAGETVGLVIEVDRTFKPGGNDPRELGIRIFHVYIEPR